MRSLENSKFGYWTSEITRKKLIWINWLVLMHTTCTLLWRGRHNCVFITGSGGRRRMRCLSGGAHSSPSKGDICHGGLMSPRANSSKTLMKVKGPTRRGHVLVGRASMMGGPGWGARHVALRELSRTGHQCGGRRGPPTGLGPASWMSPCNMATATPGSRRPMVGQI